MAIHLPRARIRDNVRALQTILNQVFSSERANEVIRVYVSHPSSYTPRIETYCEKLHQLHMGSSHTLRLSKTRLYLSKSKRLEMCDTAVDKAPIETLHNPSDDYLNLTTAFCKYHPIVNPMGYNSRTTVRTYMDQAGETKEKAESTHHRSHYKKVVNNITRTGPTIESQKETVP